MDVQIYINGVLRTDLRVLQLKRSYLEPWTALLRYNGRHDACGMPRMWDSVLICQVAESGGTTTTTSGGYPGPVLFRGDITDIAPGGIAEESWNCTASGKRFRLENEPVCINGRGHYVWNRRGHTCNNESGEDSPGADGGKWTAGEIAVDILEHALGIPAGGSDISGHHGDPCCVTDTYLTAGDIAGYTAADWLALDTVIGEFSVDNTPVAQALDMLLGLAGGFYGWYVDPESGNLVLTDLDACPVRNIEAGQLGHWQDEAGKNYVLLDNKLDWSLDGVCTTVIVQGTDRTVEEKPANIEGTGNPALGDAGELELVAAPWMDWPAAFRHVCQTKRLPTWREIDPGNTLTPPQGYLTWDKGPRIYKGTDAGAKYVYVPDTPGVPLPSWNRVTGIISFYENPSLDPGEKLWGWYFARVPFTVQAGPDGDAYWHYGYENTLIIYDPAFKHTTSWPRPGTADDEVAMGILAERILRQRKDVRRQGVLVCDEVDPSAFGLDVRYNVLNLGCTSTLAPATTTAAPGTSTTTLPPDPMRWDELQINAVEVVYDLDRNETQITVANTFFMLEGYSELKRRLEQNLFARRELDLSEDVNDCQVLASAYQGEVGTPTSTTTEAPSTSTTTEAPGPTTSTTTTEAPEFLCSACEELAREAGGRCVATVTMVDTECSGYGSGCEDAAGQYELRYHEENGWWQGGAENPFGSWAVRVECVQCPGEITTTTQAGCLLPGCYRVQLLYYQLGEYYLGYETDSAWLCCCDNGGLYGECVADGTDLCEGCSVRVVFGCPPTTTSTTTQPPSTTTTLPPTTTTTAGPGCPTDEWCANNCPTTVYAEITTGCGSPPDVCDGLWQWTWLSDCTWTNTGTPAMGCGSGGITCSTGTWSFDVGLGTDVCVYHKTATTDSCPTGNYSLYSAGCPDCDPTATVYT